MTVFLPKKLPENILSDISRFVKLFGIKILKWLEIIINNELSHSNIVETIIN